MTEISIPPGIGITELSISPMRIRPGPPNLKSHFQAVLSTKMSACKPSASSKRLEARRRSSDAAEIAEREVAGRVEPDGSAITFRTDSELREVGNRPGQHCLTAAHDDGSLNQLGMFRHDADELIVAQGASCNMLAIGVFFGS